MNRPKMSLCKCTVAILQSVNYDLGSWSCLPYVMSKGQTTPIGNIKALRSSLFMLWCSTSVPLTHSTSLHLVVKKLTIFTIFDSDLTLRGAYFSEHSNKS